MTLRKAVFYVTICFVVLASAMAHPQSAPARPDLKIFYTGYLLGYYRAPDIQPSDFSACDGPRSKPAVRFLSEIETLRAPQDVLVGMGDNFGVELYSRTFGTASQLHPKTHAPNDPRWSNDPPDQIGDNVACFLSLAHYDAIVPGKEDFYFGPERLRRIATRLAATPETEKFHPVQMLAANLVVNTSLWKEAEEVPDSRKELPYKPEMPDGVDVNISDGDTVLPFATITFKQQPPSPPYLCQAAEDGRPDSIFASSHCAWHSLQQLPADPAHPGARYSLAGLTGNPDYGLCLDIAGEHYCLRFTLGEPFVQASSGGNPRVNWANPYYYDARKNVVIFGVVDPEIASLVGHDNLAWRNHKYRQEVAALDPGESLRQAIDYFYRTETIVNRPRMILLAQMNKAQADELATHFHFDFVFAKADDYIHATPQLTATLPATRAFVVVPRKAIAPDLPYKECPECPARDPSLVTDPIGTVSRSVNGGTETIDVAGELGPWDLKVEQQPSATVLHNLAPGAQQILSPSGSGLADKQAFKLAVLKILRDRTHSNVAMLQDRDYYFGPSCLKCSTPEQIERILWRGDAPRLLTVKGSTLKKVLQESAKFKQAEQQSLTRASETGRWLVTLGIQKTDEGDYMVDGVVLDPTRLYTVVTSNHIASGDTGYPEINDPDLVDQRLPDPSSANIENQRIAYVVCNSWPGAGACIDGAQFAYPDSPAKATDLGPTNSQRFRAWWGSIYNYASLPSQSAPESETQTGASWRFSVKEASFSFSRAHNNLSEVDRTSKLGGVSEPGANAANSRSFGFTLHSDLVRSGSSMDEYARLSIDYASQTSSQSTLIGDKSTPNNLPHRVALPDQFSLSSNSGVAEAGIFVHSLFGFPPPHKSFPKWGFVLGTRVEAPLSHERFTVGPHFVAADGTIDQNAFTFFLPRTTRFLGRFGLRLESTDSYLEAGYQGGYQRHILDSVTTNQGPCPLDADQSLDQCLGGQIPGLDPASVTKTLKNAWPNGFYADFGWKLALPFTKVSFITHDEAQSFQPQSGDRNTQTRYRAALENKLSVPLFGNFSFEPGFDTFLYENKVAHTHLTRITPKVAIKYSFDLFSRVPPKKSFTYKSGGSE